MVVQAIQYSRFGDEEVLNLMNIKSDSLEATQVRVEVHAVGINPIDYKTFEGAKPLRFLSFMTKLRNPSRWFESKSSLSPYVLIRGAQFTGPRHSTFDDFKILEEMVSDGKVQLNIEKEYSFSLESVREAYRSLKLGHTRGKRIIKIRE